MQAKSALVRADGVVELHAVADVAPRLPAVVHPRYAELDLTVRLYKAFEQGLFFIKRLVLFDGGRDGIEDLLGRLKKFRLIRVFCLELGEHAFGVFHMLDFLSLDLK